MRSLLKLADARIIYDKAIANTSQSKPITTVDVNFLFKILVKSLNNRNYY